MIFYAMALVCFALAVWLTREAFLERNMAAYFIASYAWVGCGLNLFIGWQ